MRYLTVIFWGFIWGEVIGYIGGQLELLQYSSFEIGIVAAVVCLVTSVATHMMADKPAANADEASQS
ncbi:hypothetical protein LROSL1_1348 [Furfurilactobacillus rossiae]|uniref:YjzD family protein n=1 Tax=Furfurilactobacillus rossiae TaxID=231049 RepID=UPI0015C0CF1F|nr:YjzD family protein [Furfurilactobacillus rossiae]MCF6165544.1 YjzD family protein [Furfurilactobacillus rossiae]QLE64165.1 hypothetical protein LROSL1_1348 [Furfurilactobacillus rossiae]